MRPDNPWRIFDSLINPDFLNSRAFKSLTSTILRVHCFGLPWLSWNTRMVVLGRQAQSMLAAGQAVLVCTLTRLESQDKLFPDWYLPFSLLESLQDKQNVLPCLQVRPKGSPWFLLFCFQDLVCNGANADIVWQEQHKPWQYSCALG